MALSLRFWCFQRSRSTLLSTVLESTRRSLGPNAMTPACRRTRECLSWTAPHGTASRPALTFWEGRRRRCRTPIAVHILGDCSRDRKPHGVRKSFSRKRSLRLAGRALERNCCGHFLCRFSLRQKSRVYFIFVLGEMREELKITLAINWDIVRELYSLISERFAEWLSDSRAYKFVRFHSLGAQLSRLTFFGEDREAFVEELRSMRYEGLWLGEVLNEWWNWY